MLECRMIKEIKPLYNKMMKSPMSYPYLIINMNEEYPSIEIANEPVRNEGVLCWGPYTNKNTLERGIQGIKECCKILCSSNFRKPSGCLNHSIGLCIGVCLEQTSRELYLEIIERIIKLLDGDDTSILNDLENMMNSAAEKIDFENAAKYRDYINALNYIISKPKVVEFTEANQSIVLIEYLNGDSFKLFLIKGSRVLLNEKYCISSFDTDKLINTIKESIFQYFRHNNAIEIGRDQIDESQIIYSYLKSSNNSSKHAIIPQVWIENRDFQNIHAALNGLFQA